MGHGRKMYIYTLFWGNGFPGPHEICDSIKIITENILKKKECIYNETICWLMRWLFRS